MNREIVSLRHQIDESKKHLFDILDRAVAAIVENGRIDELGGFIEAIMRNKNLDDLEFHSYIEQRMLVHASGLDGRTVLRYLTRIEEMFGR